MKMMIAIGTPNIIPSTDDFSNIGLQYSFSGSFRDDRYFIGHLLIGWGLFPKDSSPEQSVFHQVDTTTSENRRYCE